MNLTIDIVENIKSQLLANELVKIIAKLRDAAKSAFTRHIEEYGYQKVREIVEISVSLGNIAARDWLWEISYAEWFAVNNINNSIGWVA